eukprot:5737230-Amphidinium_carterae.1
MGEDRAKVGLGVCIDQKSYLSTHGQKMGEDRAKVGGVMLVARLDLIDLGALWVFTRKQTREAFCPLSYRGASLSFAGDAAT